MLIPGMQAMSSKVFSRRIILEVVPGCDDWVGNKTGPGKWLLSVERSVQCDRSEGGDQSGKNQGDA